jgi:hypothetical protein
VPPGQYSVRMTFGASPLTGKLLVEDDPRVTLTPEDRAIRTQAITELLNMTRESDAAQRQFTALRTAVTSLRDSWKRPGAPPVPAEAGKALDDLEKKMEAIEKTTVPDLAAGTPSAEFTPPPIAQRISRLMTAIDSYAFKPTDDQLAELTQLRAEMPQVNARISQIVAEDLPAFNKAINASGVPILSIAEEAPQPQRRRQ